jgi:hypothetical protein
MRCYSRGVAVPLAAAAAVAAASFLFPGSCCASAFVVVPSQHAAAAAAAATTATSTSTRQQLSPTTKTTAATTASATATALAMVARNANFAKLAGGYLFPEIGRRRSAYAAAHPELRDRIISLGIGDTTQPIPPHILSGLADGAAKLGTASGYSGYGDVQGRTELRARIASALYGDRVDADEVFVSGTCAADTGGCCLAKFEIAETQDNKTSETKGAAEFVSMEEEIFCFSLVCFCCGCLVCVHIFLCLWVCVLFGSIRDGE